MKYSHEIGICRLINKYLVKVIVREAPQLARQLGVGNIWIKDETRRFEMPSFKILGTSWAVYRALMSCLGKVIESWETFDDLATIFAPLRPLTLVAATDGNHGRAVAHMAALRGFDSHIFVPQGMAESRINAIKIEGAKVTIVNGTNDEAVRMSALEQNETHILISDTSWPGYEEIPTWVINGYATIFQEVGEQLARQFEPGPDLFISIEDEWACQGMRKFAALGLVSGETSAAGIGGVLALLHDPSLSAARA